VPLEPGSSNAVVGRNIQREEEAGKPKAQAEAIALKEAGKSNQDALSEALPATITAAELSSRNREYWKNNTLAVTRDESPK
jgi:hypothetical protein